MSKVLVTGGAGFIGSHLVELLIRRGHEVLVFDNYSSGKKENLPDTGWKRTLRPFRDMEEGMIVYHLAAHADISWSQAHPFRALDIDYGLTRELVEEAHKKKVDRFVFVSSSGVYAQSVVDQDENHTRIGARTPYAASKLAGEIVIEMTANLGLPALSIRPFNVYGPRQRIGGVDKPLVPSFILASMRGEPLKIQGSGHQAVDFMYVGDVAESLTAIMDVPRSLLLGQAVNLASGKTYSVMDMAHLIDGDVARVEYTPERKWFFGYTQPIITRARELGIWRGSTPIEQGLEKTTDYYARAETV